MSSLSDQFRRLFSGTLGLLPIVFPNRAQGGTLVHFWRDCPSNTHSKYIRKTIMKAIFHTKRFDDIQIGACTVHTMRCYDRNKLTSFMQL